MKVTLQIELNNYGRADEIMALAYILDEYESMENQELPLRLISKIVKAIRASSSVIWSVSELLDWHDNSLLNAEIAKALDLDGDVIMDFKELLDSISSNLHPKLS